MRLLLQRTKHFFLHARPKKTPMCSAMHCKDKIPKISKQIFPEKEYRGLSPNFHIHASVSHLYISTIGLLILLEEICKPILGLYKSLTDTWMLKFGLRPRYSQKRNTYMGFSLQCGHFMGIIKNFFKDCLLSFTWSLKMWISFRTFFIL